MSLVNWETVLLDVCTSYPSHMLKVTFNMCIPLILVYYIIIYITKVGLVNGTRGGDFKRCCDVLRKMHASR